MSNLVEKLREENAFLNDMLENAHNRSRILEQQLTDGNNIIIAHANTISRVETANCYLQEQVDQLAHEVIDLERQLASAYSKGRKHG